MWNIPAQFVITNSHDAKLTEYLDTKSFISRQTNSHDKKGILIFALLCSLIFAKLFSRKPQWQCKHKFFEKHSEDE